MAENEEQDQEQEESQASLGVPGSDQAAAPSQGKKGFLLIIILVVVVLALVGAGAAVFFLFFKKADRGLAALNPEDVKYIEEYNLRKQDSIEVLKPNKEPVFSDFYPYTVNMRDGKHMLQITFRCLMYDNGAVEYLKGRRPEIDDAFLAMFKEVRPEDLRNRAGLELLKIEILKTINTFFSQDFIDLSASKDRHPVKEILIVEYYIN